jgi:hypothetical protein
MMTSEKANGCMCNFHVKEFKDRAVLMTYLFICIDYGWFAAVIFFDGRNGLLRMFIENKHEHNNIFFYPK